MRRKFFPIAGIACCMFIFSYFVHKPDSPESRLKDYFQLSFKTFIGTLHGLEHALQTSADSQLLQRRFVEARLAYKKIELVMEYYYELDVSKINGPAIDFIEEEDPNAYHQPQGLQVIESLLYPSYDTTNKPRLLEYSGKLISLCEGLAANSNSFEPQAFILEAVMEETYRVLALGITGFDSPVALNSLEEAVSSLESIDEVLSFYQDISSGQHLRFYEEEHRLAHEAIAYLKAHNNFIAFDRMYFIRAFLNPLSRAIGRQRDWLGQSDNAFHYSLIRKKTDLFSDASFRTDAYLFDDTITAARIDLGKQLFAEPLLSANGKRSCASCHQPAKAFTDGRQKALQLDGHTILARNTPTLLNAAFQHNLFYDSRQASLDQLINEVLGNEKEMNRSADSSVGKLQGNPAYMRLYSLAYPFAKGPMKARFLVNAISMYLRTLRSYNSRFDKHMRGTRDVLKANEVAGFNLFMGKARCATCHFVPLFNGSKPATYFYQEGEVIGVPSTTDTLHPELDGDLGRYNLLQKEFLKHSFKTPTLRNIALTAPYMHNGVFPDLKSVMHFYNKGGGSGLHIAPPNQTLPFEELKLSPKEEDQVIAFLNSLTDLP